MTDIGRRSVRHRAGEQAPAGAASAPGSALPEALVQEQARIVRSRSKARRVLARGRARRRVVPPLVAGSGALLGSTMIGAWVFGQAPAATTPTFTRVATTATTAPSNPDQAQLNLDVAALTRLRQALAADDAAISGLTPSAAGSGAPTAQAGTSTGSGATPASPTGASKTPGVPGATVTTNPPLAALPGMAAATPLGPLPTVPTVSTPTTTAPPTHTTTGATVAVP